MKNLIIAFSVVFSMSSLANSTVLVSDIDDTIKVSHVLDPDSTMANVAQIKNAFMGMADLYQKLIDDKSVDEVAYLSNAPEAIMRPFHRSFLSKNNFPEGSLFLNHSLSSKNHKINSLRNIIKQKSPKLLVLIGDNGEKDTLVYAQIQKEFPETKMITFIHLAYSLQGHERDFGKPLEENQIGFATSLDLAAQLFSRGLISEISYDKLMNKIAPKALREDEDNERWRPMMFPAWFDCRDLKVTDLPIVKAESTKLTLKFQKKLTERCSTEPFGH